MLRVCSLQQTTTHLWTIGHYVSQKRIEKTAGGLYKLHLMWICRLFCSECISVPFVSLSCRSVLLRAYFMADMHSCPMANAALVQNSQQTFGLRGERKGSKATLDVNLKNCGLRHTAPLWIPRSLNVSFSRAWPGAEFTAGNFPALCYQRKTPRVKDCTSGTGPLELL